MIEHVANPAEFCNSLASLTVPEGGTVISTINRSMRSYATAIIAAEYILRWVRFFFSKITALRGFFHYYKLWNKVMHQTYLYGWMFPIFKSIHP